MRNYSPWIAQLEPDPAPCPLRCDTETDVAVIGAGIAGIATAFFILRNTQLRVLLLERGRVARGATGNNAGQLVTYFERPLCDLADSYGFELAIAAQREMDRSWELLDIMVDESGATAPVDRFVGHMGMFAHNHVETHLRNNALRQRAGLELEQCIVSEDAEFLPLLLEHGALYSVVPQARIRQLLGTTDDRYRAVLSHRKGCANAALLCQQVLAHLQRAYPSRFRFADHTPIRRIVLEASCARLESGQRRVQASKVVLCTNGFLDHTLDNRVGGRIDAGMHQQVRAIVGYMAGFVEEPGRAPEAISFIRNRIIGGPSPYLYVTRRPFEHEHRPTTLTCLGGPEAALESVADYDAEAPFPPAVIDHIDRDIRPLIHPSRPAGLDYDYTWHGLMGYTKTKIRLAGFEPRNPVLAYNLGCNGVGFLPSICGGHRIARLLTGEQLAPSLFDP